MAIRITCPACDETFSVSEGLRGKKTACKECGKAVTVPVAKVDDDDDDDADAKEEAVVQKKGPAPVKQAKQVKQAKPIKASTPAKSRPVCDDDDTADAEVDDVEVDDEEDAEDESPRRKKSKTKKQKSKQGLVIAGGGGGASIVGLVLYLLLRGGNSLPSPDNNNPQPVAQNPPVQQPVNPAPNPPVNPPENNPSDPNANQNPPPINPPPEKKDPVDKTADPLPKVDPPKQGNPPTEVPVGGVLKGEKVYERLLKSTVWIVAPQKGGVAMLPKTQPDPGTQTNPPPMPQPMPPPQPPPQPPVQPPPQPQPQPPVQPQPQPANNLAGTQWAGNETLQGFGRLQFNFNQGGGVIMNDAEGTSAGNYSVNGNNVTLNFPGSVSYNGTINGNAMSGNATNTKNNWTWNVIRQGGGFTPKGPKFKLNAQFAPAIVPGGFQGGLGQPALQNPQKQLQNQGQAQAGQNPPPLQAPQQDPRQQPSSQGQGQAQPGQVPPGQAPPGGIPVQGQPALPAQPDPGAAQPHPDPGGSVMPSVATGTGALIDRKHRLVITNVHVVGDYAGLKLHFPEYDGNGDLVAKREDYVSKPGMAGRVVAQEPRADLALVQLDKLPPNVQALPLSKSTPSPAQQVHSLGNPGASRALWIYSPGKVRQLFQDKWKIADNNGKVNQYDAWRLETDSPINPGDSGGPLVNERGSLVGIAHAGNFNAQNMSVFIEVREVKSLIEKYYKSIGETWTPEPESGGSEVNVTQMADWIKKLAHDDFAVRVQAAQFLGNLGGDGTLAFSPLFKALHDKEELVRRAVGDVIEKVPPHSSDVAMLAEACKNQAEPMQVRLIAARCLGRLGPTAKAAVPVLLALAKSKASVEGEELPRAALQAVAAIGPEAKDVTDLTKLLKTGSAADRALVLDALARLGPHAKKAAPEIAALAKTGDQTTRLKALQVLQTSGAAGDDMVSILNDLLKDADKEIAVEAARTLVKAGKGPTVVTFLTKEVKAGPEKLRLSAIQALAEIGPPAKKACFDLAFALDEVPLRAAAVDAFVKIGKDAAPTLANKLGALVSSKMHPESRLACLACLGKVDLKALSAKDGYMVAKVLMFVVQSDPVMEHKAAAAAILKKHGVDVPMQPIGSN